MVGADGIDLEQRLAVASTVAHQTDHAGVLVIAGPLEAQEISGPDVCLAPGHPVTIEKFKPLSQEQMRYSLCLRCAEASRNALNLRRT
jgi:hypothetical protein